MQATMVDRFFGWMLDHDGELYGDEQERLRWYEGSAVVLPLQTITVSWAVAIAALVGNRAATWAFVGVLAALYLPLWLLKYYVRRRRVRTVLGVWSRLRVVLTVLALVPYVVAVFAIARDADVSESFQVGMVTGVVLGMAGGLAAVVLRRRREGARELDTADVE